MIYQMYGNQIHVTDYRYINYIQDKDSSTQEYFKDETTAVNWVKGFIQSMMAFTITKCSSEFKNSEDKMIDAAKEKENFFMNITCDLKDFNGTLDIDLLDSELKIIQDFKVKFENSKAILSLNIEKEGDYYLAINGLFILNKVPYYTLDEIHKYKITIIK